jgi:Ribonuclease G/E
MKQGRIAVWDQVDGRPAAALLVDGRLSDLLIDPKDDRAIVGSIYRAKAGIAMKGQGGIIVELGGGLKGYLKGGKGISPGEMMTVQVATYAEPGKASPVSDRLLFKSRFCIVTPGAKGYNVARTIRDEEERERLQEIAYEIMSDAPEGFGLILRSACFGVDAEEIANDITDMLNAAVAVTSDTSSVPSLLIGASAQSLSIEAWSSPAPDELVSEEGSFESLGVWDHIHALESISTPLKNSASFTIEPTRALVAVDVNTGGDFSLNAGLKANLETARRLPQALRLRGLGGQIVIDFAPSPKKDRRQIEQTLRGAFKTDGIDTALVGWTPLGHFELQRKRERIPLSEVI